MQERNSYVCMYSTYPPYLSVCLDIAIFGGSNMRVGRSPTLSPVMLGAAIAVSFVDSELFLTLSYTY